MTKELEPISLLKHVDTKGGSSIYEPISLERKALAIVEHICYTLNPDEDNEVLNEIYKIVHVAMQPPCFASHKDWLKELEELYQQIEGE